MTQKIGIFAACLAVPAAFLRALEIQFAYNPENGIPIAMHPTRIVIWVLAIAVLAMAIVFSAPLKADKRSYEQLYANPTTGRKTTAVIAAFLMIAGGVLGIMQTITSGDMYKIDPNTMRPTLDLLGGVTVLGLWIATMVTGFAYLLLLKARQQTMTASTAIWTTLPIYWAGFNLIVAYKEASISPFVTRYVMDLAVAGCLMVAAYYHAGLLYGKPRLRLFTIFAALAIFFGITSLGEAAMSLMHADLYTAASTDAIYRSICFVASALWLVGEFPSKSAVATEHTA